MNAVIYARFSSDRQREESIEGQIRECRSYAERNGITIVDTYIDRAKSASKDTDKRESFLKMIRDSSKHLFEVVLVWKLDRFARSRYDSAHYKAALKKNGVKLLSATEHITEGPEGIILESMLEGMAEYYSAELSEKIHRGQKDNALKGRNNGGRIPLGYLLNKETQKLEVNPLTAPVVQEIFQRYAAGDTIANIRDDFNQRGIKTDKGNPFRYSSFNTVLKNRKYIGEYKYQDVVIPDGVPAIVPEDVFNRVQERMEKNRMTPAAAKAPERYLLTTKLFCGECGKMLAGESGTGTGGKIYRYYKCHSAKNKKDCHQKPVKKAWIENYVVQQTMMIMMDGPLMERITDRLLELQGEGNHDLKLLEQQLKDTERGIENILNAIQAGIITASTKQRLSELEDEKADLEQRILQERISHPALTREQISVFLDKFKNMNKNDEEDRQRLIDSFLNAVYIDDEKVVLVFNYKGGTKTVSLKDVNGSGLEGECPPKQDVVSK
jgi:DNA invertase Pin-like site-specific DNA recombinase